MKVVESKNPRSVQAVESMRALMKVYVETSRAAGMFTVRLKQGGQSFRIDYRGTRADCLWYDKQFRKALKNHDMFVIAKHEARQDRIEEDLL